LSFFILIYSDVYGFSTSALACFLL